MENKAESETKPTPVQGNETGDGAVVKSASQLKKEAKKQAKLDKFNKKKEQQAEQKNQGEVSWFSTGEGGGVLSSWKN